MSNLRTKDKCTTKQEKKQRDFLEVLASKRRNIKKVRKCGKDYFTEGTYNRMGRCREKLWIWTDKDKRKKKVVAVNESCRSPWCPVCALFKARKEAGKIATCAKWIQMEKHKDFIFLTLTAPNVTGDKLLKEEIGRYNKAFNNLMGRDEVKRAVKGYIRKLEVTYNKNRIITPEMWYGNKKKHIKAMGYYFQSLGLKIGDKNPNYNTYHPHFHVMIAINKSYFTSRDYITPKHWLELWQEVMQDTTITQVDVVRVRLDAAGKEISEIAKYTAKDSDYTVSEEVFGAYYRALTHRQKITYGGLFAEAGKMYDNGELNDYRDKDLTEYIYELFYKWEKAKGEYLLEDVRELTPEERTKYHGQAVEEMNIED